MTSNTLGIGGVHRCGTWASIGNGIVDFHQCGAWPASASVRHRRRPSMRHVGQHRYRHRRLPSMRRVASIGIGAASAAFINAARGPASVSASSASINAARGQHRHRCSMSIVSFLSSMSVPFISSKSNRVCVCLMSVCASFIEHFCMCVCHSSLVCCLAIFCPS